MKSLATFIEQITPDFQKKNTLPGDTFIEIYRKLKFGSATLEEQRKIALVFEVINQLPTEAFCMFIGIFDEYLMHSSLPRKEDI